MHARFEPLLLFFIDGASLIEKGDDKWEALLAVQPAKGGGHLLVRHGFENSIRGWCSRLVGKGF